MRAGHAGLVFALASALGYGAALPLSRMAFDHGTNALTVGLLRYVALALLLWGWVVLGRRRAARLGRRERLLCFALGACFAGVSLGTLLGSTYMPVSLVVLVFYTYPSLVLGLSAILERRRPTPAEIGLVLMAFLGLGLALDVRIAAASLPGVGFGALAAFATVLTFLIIERGLAAADSVRATAVAVVAAAVVCAGALAGPSGFALPGSTTGWLLLTAVLALFAAAVVCMFQAIRRAGSLPASMLLFLEPITAIVLSVALLAESLDRWQWLGAALVVSAVALTGLRSARSARERAGSVPVDGARDGL